MDCLIGKVQLISIRFNLFGQKIGMFCWKLQALLKLFFHFYCLAIDALGAIAQLYDPIPAKRLLFRVIVDATYRFLIHKVSMTGKGSSA